METVLHEKRLEVAKYYILGYTYAEIEQKTAVSHGTVANVIKELETGKLVIPGIPSDEIHDLRLLSLDLVKKGLQPSQALLGVTLFEKFTQLEITPSQYDQWSKLIKILAPEGFPAKEFFEAALHLHQLEDAQKKSFQDILEEYTKLKQEVGVLGSAANLLEKKNNDLSGQAQSLTLQVDALKKEVGELDDSFKAKSTELEKVKMALEMAKQEHVQVTHEFEDLKKSKTGLCLEVDGKTKSLAVLKEIGFSEEDLLHLRKVLEGMAVKDGGSADEVKDRFFFALG
jgi:outer membrane murein-binding lipoprotein Lpp